MPRGPFPGMRRVRLRRQRTVGHPARSGRENRPGRRTRSHPSESARMDAGAESYVVNDATSQEPRHLALDRVQIGARTLSFDPGHVVLKFEDGEMVQLASYRGPDLLRVNPRAVGPSCGWASQRLQVKAPRGPIPFTWRACFLLLFDTSASPERSFTLVIDELRKAGEYVPILSVDFKRGSVRKYQQV